MHRACGRWSGDEKTQKSFITIELTEKLVSGKGISFFACEKLFEAPYWNLKAKYQRDVVSMNFAGIQLRTEYDRRMSRLHTDSHS